MVSVHVVNPILIPFSIDSASRAVLQKTPEKRNRGDLRSVKAREIHAFCVKFTQRKAAAGGGR
jgi:hypothetical protein